MNREERREYARTYYAKHRIRILQNNRQYRINYYQRNKKRLLAYQNAYHRNQNTATHLKPITKFKKIVKSVTIKFD